MKNLLKIIFLGTILTSVAYADNFGFSIGLPGFGVDYNNHGRYIGGYNGYYSPAPVYQYQQPVVPVYPQQYYYQQYQYTPYYQRPYVGFGWNGGWHHGHHGWGGHHGHHGGHHW